MNYPIRRPIKLLVEMATRRRRNGGSQPGIERTDRANPACIEVLFSAVSHLFQTVASNSLCAASANFYFGSCPAIIPLEASQAYLLGFFNSRLARSLIQMQISIPNIYLWCSLKINVDRT